MMVGLVSSCGWWWVIEGEVKMGTWFMKMLLMMSVVPFPSSDLIFPPPCFPKSRGSVFSLKLFLQGIESSHKIVEEKKKTNLPNRRKREARNRMMVNAIIIGLGAGLLPMFLHGCMPSLQIEVVELDAVVRSLQGITLVLQKMNVHIADGIRFVREVKSFAVADGLPAIHWN
ncbi:hypothetical protein NC651_000042 [Populus alba x Populus x berolinensis]|nr:hypothetical protein NC651_000042 [Populus alba x Populus x berolinensis]